MSCGSADAAGTPVSATPIAIAAANDAADVRQWTCEFMRSLLVMRVANSPGRPNQDNCSSTTMSNYSNVCRRSG